MMDEKQKLQEIIDLGFEIRQVQDLDLLLEHILTKARRFTNADAGSIYMVEKDRLTFKCNQNDTLQAKLAPGKKLIYSSFTVPIDTHSISGSVASSGEMLNIPDVYEIPPGAPYSFDRHYDELSQYRTHSMLTIPLKTTAGKVVGVLQLINARAADGAVVPFAREDEPLIVYFANNAATSIERAQMTRALLLRMIGMAELRDPKETGAHVNRVASYSVEIYEVWANTRCVACTQVDRNKDILRMAAMLHDVGKVAISDTILKKPAKLDEAEYAVMKQHTFLGARLFSDLYSDFDEAAYQVALNHHERWDGKGYPGHINPHTGKAVQGYENSDGSPRPKKGEEIPPFGRVVAIADVYDALSSRRAYKEPWSEDRVLENLRSEAGKQFDPDMIEAFFESLDVIRSIEKRYPEG
ncbi:MAG TPA: HD domain-containing protein [Spirochaetota bacterium]|nr:HD domain-containing protein [Spirochaetota bacterium]